MAASRALGHVGDRVCEQILQAIGRRTELKVVGRAASFQARGAATVVRRVVEELRATHLVDGSVRESGGRVRVSAHLIEGLATLWSATFERELAEVFDLQDAVAVAEAVVMALRGVLGEEV